MDRNLRTDVLHQITLRINNRSHGRFAAVSGATKRGRTMTCGESCDPMRKKHAVRALVLHATPTGDFYVSACDGTATTVLVCRSISPFPRLISINVCI